MKRATKLGLGTAQWGLHYGLANQYGLTPPETVRAILKMARVHGVQVLDTASVYGEAEVVLGGNSLDTFRVVSKTPRFATPFITDEQAHQLVQGLHYSLKRLSCKKIYGLLVHHAEDLFVPGGEKLVAALTDLKVAGEVENIGVSVYDEAQVEAVLKVFKPDIVQLPVSVLDQRMLLNGQLKRLKQEGIEIHCRSVFLQGLLLMPLNCIPAYFEPIRKVLLQWHEAAQDQGMTLVQAAMSFVRDIPYVDTVLVGVESLAQFQSCLEDFSVSASFNASSLFCNDPKFVNPALWKI